MHALYLWRPETSMDCMAQFVDVLSALVRLLLCEDEVGALSGMTVGE